MRTTSPIPKPITISLSLRVSAASGDSAPATRSRYRFLGEFKPLLGISTELAETISDTLRARQAAVIWGVGNGGKKTRRQGDKETRRRKILVPLSPCPLVPPSPCLPPHSPFFISYARNSPVARGR